MNQYSVGSDPALAHPNFNGSDHTTGSGHSLITEQRLLISRSIVQL